MGMTAHQLTGTSWRTATVYKNLAWMSTIPALLALGYCPKRHELLAQHQANAPQFYAECAQLKVAGIGTAVSSGAYLATIPGYAPESDPGIIVSLIDMRNFYLVLD
jgi:hypothetical protein